MPLIYDQARTQFEVTYLKRLLSKAGNNLKTASRLSGLELSTLYRRKYRLAK
jgi:transcriptional regulator of acetoin/glycerol metabolism